jgi:hypothetical protein
VLAFGKEAEHAADGSHASVIAFGSAQATVEDRQRKKDAAAAAKTAKRYKSQRTGASGTPLLLRLLRTWKNNVVS